MGYTTDADDPSLFPDEGYGIVLMDMYKTPDDDDFINMIAQYDTKDEVTVPRGSQQEIYYVHAADGETWTAKQWRAEFGEDD